MANFSSKAQLFIFLNSLHLRKGKKNSFCVLRKKLENKVIGVIFEHNWKTESPNHIWGKGKEQSQMQPSYIFFLCCSSTEAHWTRSQGRQGRKDLQGAEERYTLNKYLEIIENTYVGQCRDYGEEISKKGQLESHMPLKPGTTYRPTRFEELGAICRWIPLKYLTLIRR